MSIRYLLDTNVVSEPIARPPHERVMEQLAAHPGQVATASVVVHELVFGAARLPRSVRRRDLERYLEQVVLPSMPILPYDSQAALWHATERARLEASGQIVPFVDAQLAAIAVTNGLTLVSRNRRDFARFHELRCVSWHD